MEKTIAACDARRQFGKILTDVLTHGDRFVVERDGQPVAAVVPIEVYEQCKKVRSVFFARARAAAQRANLSPDEADQLAEEAVRAMRAANAGGE